MCGGTLTRGSGCRRVGDRWVVDAATAVGAVDAAHLGDLDACPVAMVEAAGPWLGRAVQAYRATRRLGVPPRDPSPRLLACLLALDDEAERLAGAERRRAEAARGVDDGR
jgi:hypothetical protein